MAREFDIFLNHRLTECDIAVYSMPFRDGIAAVDRVVLKSCIQSYLLQRFIAAQTNSELTVSIDRSLRMCVETISESANIDVDAGFDLYGSLYPDKTAAEICSDAGAWVRRVITESVSEANLGNSDIPPFIYRVLAGCVAPAEIGSSISSSRLTKTMSVYHAIDMVSSISESVLKPAIVSGSKAILDSEVSFACKRYRLLGEIDAENMSAYNGMTMDDMSFILL